MKTIELDGVGQIILRKSKRAKRVILKIDNKGNPVIILPHLAPYAIAKSFAKQHQSWFADHLDVIPKVTLQQNNKIGRYHKLNFCSYEGRKPKSLVKNNIIKVYYPPELTINSQEVQAEATKASTRALKKEALLYLPKRLHSLAQFHGYNYSSVGIKTMYSRWGSCSNSGVINLSVWLMQLPDDLIEYVLCHELAHLNNPHHQKAFWAELNELIVDYADRRKRLKNYSPKLAPQT